MDTLDKLGISGPGKLEQDVLVLFNSPLHHYVTPKFYTETKPTTAKVSPIAVKFLSQFVYCLLGRTYLELCHHTSLRQGNDLLSERLSNGFIPCFAGR